MDARGEASHPVTPRLGAIDRSNERANDGANERATNRATERANERANERGETKKIDPSSRQPPCAGFVRRRCRRTRRSRDAVGEEETRR